MFGFNIRGQGVFEGEKGIPGKGTEDKPTFHLTARVEKIVSSPSQSLVNMAHLQGKPGRYGDPPLLVSAPPLHTLSMRCAGMRGSEWKRVEVFHGGCSTTPSDAIDLNGRRDRSKQPVPVVRIDQRRGGCI